LSRGVSRSTTRVLVKPKQELDSTRNFTNNIVLTKNIVYKEVLNC